MNQSKTQSLVSLLSFVLAVVCLGWSIYAYGCAVEPYRGKAIILTVIAAVFAIFALPKTTHLPNPGKILGTCLLLLLLYGWFMVLNARAEHSVKYWTFHFIENRFWEGGPGSVAKTTSFRAMVEFSAVALAVLAAVRAAQTNAWRWLIGLIIFLGAGVAVTGLFHKLIELPSVYGIDQKHPPTYFAPYIYNANAGSFLNICTALAFGMSLGQGGTALSKSFRIAWGVLGFICGIAVFATASKAASLIVLGIFLATVVLNKNRLLYLFKNRGRQSIVESATMYVIVGAIVVALLYFGVQLVGNRFLEFFERIEQTGQSESIEGRVIIIKVLLKMCELKEAGFGGFGPGTFQHLVPYFTVDPELRIQARYVNGHCDPLQTIAEWGYIGAAAWFTIGIGAIVSGFFYMRSNKTKPNHQPVVRSMIIALAATAFHSCFDFPFSIYSIHIIAALLCGVLWGLWMERKRANKTIV